MNHHQEWPTTMGLLSTDAVPGLRWGLLQGGWCNPPQGWWCGGSWAWFCRPRGSRQASDWNRWEAFQGLIGMASQAESTRGLLGNSTLRAVCTASRSCYLIIPTELHTLKLSLECKGHGGEDVSSTAALNSKTRYKALLQKSLFWKLLRTSTTFFSPMHPNSDPQSPSLCPRCPCWSPRPTAVLPHLSKVLLFHLQKACETQRPPFHFSLWILLTSGTHEIPGLRENNCFSGDLNM